MSDDAALDELIREVAGRGVSIMLLGCTAHGLEGVFSGSVHRHPIDAPDSPSSHRRGNDPIAVLRSSLIEYLRVEADTARRYAAAPKLGSLPVGPCTRGVGCDEAGVCYADHHGEPDRCGRTDQVPAIDDTEDLLG